MSKSPNHRIAHQGNRGESTVWRALHPGPSWSHGNLSPGSSSHFQSSRSSSLLQSMSNGSIHEGALDIPHFPDKSSAVHWRPPVTVQFFHGSLKVARHSLFIAWSVHNVEAEKFNAWLTGRDMGAEEKSWIPACHISDPDLITQFYWQQPDQPTKVDRLKWPPGISE